MDLICDDKKHKTQQKVQDNIVSRIEEFREERHIKQLVNLRQIWVKGLEYLCLGYLLSIIFHGGVLMDIDFYFRLISAIVSCGCLAVGMTGMIMLSTVDSSKMNFDMIVEDDTLSSKFVRISTFGILLLNAISWYGQFAVASVILIPYTFVFLMREDIRFLPKLLFSLKFVVYMQLDEILGAFGFLFLSLEAYFNNDKFIEIRTFDGFMSNMFSSPSGSTLFVPYLSFSIYMFLEFGISSYYYMRQLNMYFKDTSKGISPTGIQYISFYLYLFRFGLLIWVVVLWNLFDKSEKNEKFDLLYLVFYGFTGSVTLSPPFVVALLTPKRIFKVSEYAFERLPSTAAEDGRFIAELLESVDVELNQQYWVHYDKCLLPTRTNFDDHRKFWYTGVVSSVTFEKFTVNLKDTNLSLTFPRKIIDDEFQNHRSVMTQAMSDLRCVDWCHLHEDLFTKSVREGSNNFFDRSRPLQEQEQIDFFISHSWHDNGAEKYEKLLLLASDFKIKYGRDPTFWLDKVCFDQERLSDSLKALPINVMACRKVLILCGKSYCTRLWCIWEIFTVLSFTDFSEAYKKLEILPIDNLVNLEKELCSFSVENCKCYDPNEEQKIFNVIKACCGSKGLIFFNEQIRRLSNSVNVPLDAGSTRFKTFSFSKIVKYKKSSKVAISN